MSDRIGRYRTERVLGSGGFATVWLAVDETLDAPVAIKVLADNWARDDDIRRRFIEEARILRRADSEHIVRVHAVDELPDGRPYFVMEYADRGTLQERMEKRAADGSPFGIEEALGIAVEIGKGLRVAHALGVAHRDLKPANVMFRSRAAHQGGDGEERLLLADFGIAKSLAGRRATTIASGSPRYMAPEQAMGRADERTDIYSAGAILYELLAGRAPYPYDSLPRLLQAQQAEEIPPITSLRPDAPAGLDAVLAGSLASDPDARYPTADAWLAALEAVSAGDPAPAVVPIVGDATIGPEQLRAAMAEPPPPTPDPPDGPAAAAGPPTTPPPRKPRSRLPLLLGAGGVAAALAIVLGIVFLSGGDSGDGSDAGEVFLEAVSSLGTNPFTASVVPTAGALAGQDGLDGLNAPVGETPELDLGTIDLPPLPSDGPSVPTFTGGTPGLYGGTQQLSVCDRDQLVRFLMANPDKARAWASVLSITPSEIPGYVNGLTDVVLRADTRVTNNGFLNGAPDPINAVLQAGTAVLVDAFGDLKVRCYCGNPLLPPKPLGSRTPRVSGIPWPGFDLTKTIVIEKTIEVIPTFGIDDLLSDGLLVREPGTPATAAQLIPAPPTPAPTPTAPPATTAPPPPTTAPPTTTAPPPTRAVNISGQGDVDASTTYTPGDFSPSLAVDGDPTTSWFSGGSINDGAETVYTWSLPRDELIVGVDVINNANHANPDFRTRYGFEEVAIEVLDAAGSPVYSETLALPGQPDPNLRVRPNVTGRTVALHFHGHEEPDCGGISELVVRVAR